MYHQSLVDFYGLVLRKELFLLFFLDEDNLVACINKHSFEIFENNFLGTLLNYPIFGVFRIIFDSIFELTSNLHFLLLLDLESLLKLILWTADFLDLRELFFQMLLQVRCILWAAMHQHHIAGLHLLNKLGGLIAVSMGREANFLNIHPHIHILPIFLLNPISLFQATRQTPLDTIPCQYESVLGIVAPSLKQRP